MKNCFYCIPGISLALQTKSQTELQNVPQLELPEFSKTIKQYISCVPESRYALPLPVNPNL